MTPLINWSQSGALLFDFTTLSDQALMPFPSFKLGPGDSARSHSADEFIGISEITHAIETYIKIGTVI